MEIKSTNNSQENWYKKYKQGTKAEKRHISFSFCSSVEKSFSKEASVVEDK